MTKYKHLTSQDRYTIQNSLNNRFSFKAIAQELGKDCTTISKEVRNHLIFKKTGALGRNFNNCIHRLSCDVRLLCQPCTNEKYHFCNFCIQCISKCNQYQPQLCLKLSKAPYVCNGCLTRYACSLEKSLYSARDSQKEYLYIRSESRSGLGISENEVSRLDCFISPLIKKGQSIHHICSNNRDVIMCSEKTIYNYVDYNLFSARNIDLPRKVRYRPRKNYHLRFKVDRKCRINRTYEDFLAHLIQYPDTPIVQIDSVEGIKGGKVLLTIHFVESEMMLAFLRDSNDSRSVIDIFENLFLQLSPSVFMKLFPLLLGDNGSEFSNPLALEFDRQGNKRTSVYYCDPGAPHQKGSAENNHEFIRRVLPKGTSFNNLCQEDINLMMNHINSYSRKKLGGKNPYQAFKFIHGKDVLKKLGYKMIASNNIILQPHLLKK